jgi:tRNA pseudouridine(55) synthase
MPTQIFNFYKPLGLTPLEALEKFREKAKLPKELKITYAGRLDPMAEGVLLLLAGKKVYEKEKYLKLNKTYKAQILFGVSTDTFDVLGKILEVDNVLPKLNEVKKELKNFEGKILLPIPPYSSVPISGKPSFTYARAGELGVNNLKKRETEIFKITFHSYRKISATKILKTVQNKIAKVSGDFRQKEILKLWGGKLGVHPEPQTCLAGRQAHLRCEGSLKLNNTKGFLGSTRNGKNKFAILNLTISCASGTYIRSIAHTLGQNLFCPSLLYSLTRESVGKYKINKSIKLK